MAKKSTTALAKQSAAPVVKSDVPEYLRPTPGQIPAGLENIERNDMTLPRLAICQSLSPQRKKSDPKFIAGLDEGQWFNTITQKIYGTSVLVVPLLVFKSRVLFRDQKEGGGILCRADDAVIGIGEPGGNCSKCPLAQFNDGEAPECTMFYNYVSVVLTDAKQIPSIEDMAVASFKSTGLKAARDWNALLKLRNVDAFAGVYQLDSVETKNSQGVWYAAAVKPAGWATEDAFHIARELYRGVSTIQSRGSLRVDLDDIAHPTTAETTKEM